MLTALQGIAKELDTLLVSLDVATLHAPDAITVLEAASAVETRAAAIKTLVADRAALISTGGHRLEGGPGRWSWIQPPDFPGARGASM